MGLPRGHSIPLSPFRRMMCDLLHFSRKVPLVAIERHLSIPAVVAARRLADPRPSWFAVYLKAYALVCDRRPELRQSYLSFPRPRLYQHPGTVASLAVARAVGGEDAVLVYLLRDPGGLSLGEIDARIRRARTATADEIRSFRNQFRVCRLPGPVRRAGPGSRHTRNWLRNDLISSAVAVRARRMRASISPSDSPPGSRSR